MQNNRSLIPAKLKTMLDNMNLSDRFLFNETVEDPEIYNLVVEILMDNHISMLVWSETEKELRVSPQLREIRLDVIGMDDYGTLYQVEMQKKNTYNLRKRSRYYQAQIDVTLLEPGCKDFNNLNDLTTILVAPFDIFGYGLYRYTFEEHCLEIPSLKLNDGAKRIFINTNGNNPEDFSKEFLDFMNYINASTDKVAAQTSSKRIQQIHNRVCTVRASEKTGVKFMQWWEEKAYAREEGWEEGHEEGLAVGLAEGRAEGLAEGRTEGELLTLVQLVCRKLSKGLLPDQIADILETDIKNIQRIIDVAAVFAPDYDVESITKSLLKQ